MAQLLFALLPITVLSAATPWAIVAVIVLLASKNGLRAAIAFTCGWLTAIIGLGALILAGVTAAGASSSTTVSALQAGLQLGFGVALLLFARIKWGQRPAPGTVVAEPSWISRLDRINPVVAFGFGMFWINGFLVVPAALQISQSGVSTVGKGIALAFYAMGSSAVMIGIIGYRLLAPTASQEGLARLRTWVSTHSTVTVAAILAVIGAGLVIKGVFDTIALM